MSPLEHRQTARLSIRLSRPTSVEADVDVSTSGLLAITGLVCGILLSTTVLVATAISESQGRRSGMLRQISPHLLRLTRRG